MFSGVGVTFVGNPNGGAYQFRWKLYGCPAGRATETAAASRKAAQAETAQREAPVSSGGTRSARYGSRNAENPPPLLIVCALIGWLLGNAWIGLGVGLALDHHPVRVDRRSVPQQPHFERPRLPADGKFAFRSSLPLGEYER